MDAKRPTALQDTDGFIYEEVPELPPDVGSAPDDDDISAVVSALMRGGCSCARISAVRRCSSCAWRCSSTASTLRLRCSSRFESSSRCFTCSARRVSTRFSSADCSADCWKRNLASFCPKDDSRSSSSRARSRRSCSSATDLMRAASEYFFCLRGGGAREAGEG